ncbi:hypothetical protein IAS59_001565 [Cryptococcus gattii]
MQISPPLPSTYFLLFIHLLFHISILHAISSFSSTSAPTLFTSERRPSTDIIKKLLRPPFILYQDSFIRKSQKNIFLTL